MSETGVGVFEGLSDPKLDYLAKRVANTARLATYRVIAKAGDPSKVVAPADKSSIEAIVLSRFRAQPAVKQQRAVQKAKAFMASPLASRKRKFGELASIDLHSTKSIHEMARTIPIPAGMRLDAAHLKRLAADPSLFIEGFKQPDADGGFTPQADFDNLRLRIRKVKCNDETDGFFGSESGDDEISMGGVKVDETGDVHKLEAFNVGNSFEDGDSKTYNPPKKFASFNLREGNKWPKTYYVSMVLAERDNGGLPSYLSDLFKYTEDKVSELVEQFGVSALGPELGKIAGAIAVAAFQSLVEFFTEIWEDDIFPVVTAYANIKSLNHVFASGTRTSSEKSKWVKAHGGKYTIYFDWQVYEG
ncbi:hypothetical protein LRS03_26280 [Rhizobacter sp. J219]|uniref:hypothetical protein n=1 Tax=Rhizobacter sp. J219 TaxID=2898430 RepID=UPI0021512F59|nr:hypothetical protein [Rhizobacter sp. J219]MCR5881338.1 hypothetical protein [Rhizobacter sp. J219]MCR5886150.1 hypothetical protein [Rhizobacter sp. J219]MCR5886168.1 hypothetical protein [Rhizobacter sp. J219]